MTTKREGFFGTDNLHRAGWAALIGLAGFFGALIYQKAYGPQKVVVDASNYPHQSGQITAEVSPGSKEIGDLTEAIRKLAKATSGNEDQKRLHELGAEVDRLRAEVAITKKRPVDLTQSGSASSSSDGSSTILAPKTVAKFLLPETVKGYTSAKIFGVSDSTCPPSVVAPGVAITATVTFNDSSLTSRASPLRATVVKVRSQTDVLQIVEVWSEIQQGLNEISLSPKLEPGNYQLTYGFYLRSKLSGEFPPFYSKECQFVVKLA